MATLEHAPTRICVEAERAMNLRLHGSCQVPIAAYCTLDDGKLHLTGLVGDAATGRCLRAEASGADPIALGDTVAQRLLDAGAGAFLL